MHNYANVMQSYFGNNTCVMCCDKYNIATWRQTVTTSVATNSDEEKDESKDTDSEAEAGKDNEVEEFSPTTSQRKPQSKRAGRKAQWLDNHVTNMIDVICSDEYFKKKSIFTNSKHSKNGLDWSNPEIPVIQKWQRNLLRLLGLVQVQALALERWRPWRKGYLFL